MTPSVPKPSFRSTASEACGAFNSRNGHLPAARLWARCQAALPPKQLALCSLHLRRASTTCCKPENLQARRQGAHQRTTAQATSNSYEDSIQQAAAPTTASTQHSSTADGASLAAPVQFEIHRIAGDGSCLFRAIAQGTHYVSRGELLVGKELFEAGFELRREVCAEMVRRREEIEPFIPGLFDAYVSNMSLEGIWGGEPELAVAIHCIQRPIVVYKEVKSGLFGKDLEKVSVYGAEQYPGVSPVCLLFSGYHYDLLMQVVQ